MSAMRGGIEATVAQTKEFTDRAKREDVLWFEESDQEQNKVVWEG
jgi:hypothetical protein